MDARRRSGDLPSSHAVTIHETVERAFVDARDDVYRYLLTLGLDPEEAQDAAQEVFLRYYRALKKGETIENQRAWIFRVAHNHGLNLRARMKRTIPLDDILETRIAAEATADRQLAETERARALQDAVKLLSPQERRCLHLRISGLRYREIAGLMGVRISTAGKFLERAVKKLRQVADAY